MCTHMCMCMGTKTISIMDDAYNLLLKSKHKGESFSNVIRRIITSKKDVMNFAGAWKNISNEEAEEMKKNIIKMRKKSTKEILGNLEK